MPVDILSMTEEVEPGDRKLGDLLRSLDLVDADTLKSLLIEARRQRRSLRQVLLAGGYLTLYQMALIETENLDGLVLGPLRVIDRLRITAHEAVYRVFDPRSSGEAVLRHLTEAEMEVAGHPEEFRHGFTRAAGIKHPHVATTLEVLDISGRPAVLQEPLTGLQSIEWPVVPPSLSGCAWRAHGSSGRPDSWLSSRRPVLAHARRRREALRSRRACLAGAAGAGIGAGAGSCRGCRRLRPARCQLG